MRAHCLVKASDENTYYSVRVMGGKLGKDSLAGNLIRSYKDKRKNQVSNSTVSDRLTTCELFLETQTQSVGELESTHIISAQKNGYSYNGEDSA